MNITQHSQKQIDVKWRWAAIGLTLGLIIVGSDTFLEWRGPSRLWPWHGDGIIYNLNYLVSTIIFPGLIGLGLGWRQDNRRNKRSMYQK